MQQDTRRAPPSKGEIVFRFVACTSIALALYYTQELRWGPASSNVRMADIEEAPSPRIAQARVGSCTLGGHSDLLVNAASKGN